MSSSAARDLHRRRLAGEPLRLLDIRENHEFARRHYAMGLAGRSGYAQVLRREMAEKKTASLISRNL